jgi:TetR/AcrR family transcriptional regulator, cholesterol catabolism regulator
MPTRATAERGPTAQRILVDAAALFRRKGYEGTSTRGISEALGIQKASLYHHVSSKEDLLYEICLAALHDVEVGAKAAVAKAGTDPRAKLGAMVSGHTLAMLANVDFSHTMLTDMRSLSGDRLKDVVQLRDSYERWTEQLIQDAQNAGELRQDVSSRHLTLALFNLLNWTMFWYRSDGDLNPDQVAELLTTMFLDGAVSR